MLRASVVCLGLLAFILTREPTPQPAAGLACPVCGHGLRIVAEREPAARFGPVDTISRRLTTEQALTAVRALAEMLIVPVMRVERPE